MKACRGIGVSLGKEEIAAWEQEHRELLADIAPAEFDILHYGAMAELKTKKGEVYNGTNQNHPRKS